MPYSVDQLWVNEYTNNIIQLAQQNYSVFEPLVTMGDAKAERKFFDRVGSVSMAVRTTANATSSYTDVDHTKRSVAFSNYTVNLSVDGAIDVSKALVDPTSVYVNLGVQAWKRKIDEVVIAAAFANAADGKDAATSTAFPTATRTIDVNYLSGDPIGAGNGTGTWTNKAQSGLTLAKILAGRATLAGAHALGPNEYMNLVIGPNEEIDLLGIEQFTKSDYHLNYPYAKPIAGNGFIGTFLGINIYRSTLLAEVDPASASNHYRRNIMFVTSGLGAYMNQNLTVKVAENPERNFATTINLSGGIGAVRIDDSKVIEIRTASGISDAS
jgi:hypothetical protein